MNEEALKRYVAFYEQMTPASLGHFNEVMTDDARFVDPFNDVTGLEKIETVFAHMFDNLTEVKFTVRHAVCTGEDAALLSWELNAAMGKKPWHVTGMSEIGFSGDGRVNRHVDHWDAAQQFYERLPIVGSLLRGIRKRLKVA